MERKKDPGKFNVRFNIADPQQRAAAELLNQQGRCKAHFITNAVLFYTGTVPNRQTFLSPVDVAPSMDSLVKAPVADADAHLGDYDVDAIRRTMDAFRTK